MKILFLGENQASLPDQSATHYFLTGRFPKMNSPVLEAIYNRRSRREYNDAPVEDAKLREIISAGIWAPSGLNNQPWRFVIVRNREIRAMIAGQTHYSHIVLNAPALIAVYLDREAMYDEVKDHQAAGACIQNMLLAAEALELGAVWLGQILKNRDEVRRILDLPGGLELMAVIALGYPTKRDQKSSRKSLEEFIIKEL
jgi:nitroreductase